MIRVLLDKLNIKYKDINIYKVAFTHPTFANEKRKKQDYQKLEFVGDSILDMLVAEHLFENYPKFNEGELTQIRAKLVNARKLSALSTKLGLDEHILAGKNHQVIKSNKVKSDVFESLIAAIYFDLGITAVKKFLGATIFKEIDAIVSKPLKNAKTILQEHLQTESREAIVYDSKSSNGKFVVVVKHEGNIMGNGEGRSIKMAEEKAAIDALRKAGIKWS